MYPGIEFVPHGTGVRSLTPEGYDAAVDKIIPAAENLARRGVEAVMLMGDVTDVLSRARNFMRNCSTRRAASPGFRFLQ